MALSTHLKIAGLLAVTGGLFLSSSSRTLWAQQAAAQRGGIYTEAQAKRGEILYGENCAGCHAPDLSGSDIGSSLIGGGFVGKWNTRPIGTLFDYVQVAMPFNSPGGLRPQQNADILAFVLRRNGAPIGQTELPALDRALREIQFPTTTR